MTDLIVHSSITCPYCWETIGVALDTSVPEQEYVEDCSVCCQPIVIHYTATEGAIIEMSAIPESE